MRKAIFLLSILCIGTALQLYAQDKAIITISGGEVSNGVVIVTAHQATPGQPGKSSFTLQCNKGASGCLIPEAGNYVMVRLPKNYGLYDCANVDLYPSSGDSEKAPRIGEYCVVDK